MKKCFKCLTLKPFSEFYKHPKMADGHLGKCKECTKRDVKERAQNNPKVQEYDRNRPNHRERSEKCSVRNREKYNSDPVARESARESKAKWSGANPEKRKAQIYLNNAKRDGRIVPKSSCEHCGTESGRIQAHHWSYEREHWLNVVWLCSLCHGAEHRRLNDLGRDPDAQH